MKKPRVEVVCVGSELLAGRVNTHAAALGVALGDIGLTIAREHTVPDDQDIMRPTFSEVLRRADVIISCGGLGPTFDDITREMWSEATGRPLTPHAPLVRDIRRKFADRGLEMPPANLRQAMVLRGAQPIRNPNGTAPGQLLSHGRKTLVILPGPTRELFPMLNAAVLPHLRRRYKNQHARAKTFLIVGVPESKVDHIIRPLVERFQRLDGCDIIHGILASQSLITVKFRVEGTKRPAVARVARRVAAEFRAVLRPMLVGEDEEALENVVGELLEKRRQTVALAESCTGGLVAKMLTDRAGSSAYFMEAVVSYANAAKERLGVARRLLDEHGAVSDEVAMAMATAVRQRAQTTYGVSITGVAGPGGGTKEKPVGLVYIGCAGPDGVQAKRFTLKGDRAWIRQRSAILALDLLRQTILGRVPRHP